MFEVDSSVVPLLNHLHSTSDIAQELVKGRRIRYLRLCWMESPPTSAQFLTSVKTVHTLCLPHDTYLEGSIRSMFFPLLTEVILVISLATGVVRVDVAVSTNQAS